MDTTYCEMARPYELEGSVYKIKPPAAESALFVTFTCMQDEQGKWRPREVFFNTQNPTHYLWVAALSRTIAALFRTGEDITYLVRELKLIHDPQGGYYSPELRQFLPSLLAEVGYCLEKFLDKIALFNEMNGPTRKEQ